MSAPFRVAILLALAAAPALLLAQQAPRPGVVAILLTQATRELLRKYGVLGPDPTLDPIMDEVQE